jgi:NADPH-dependent curcumin reductase
MQSENLQVRMKSHPAGVVAKTNFELVKADMPTCGPEQVLVRNLFLSLDPYMRPMMDPVRSYIPHLKPGDVMAGATVGVVSKSNAPTLPPGTYVTGRLGWQTYAVATAAALRVIDPKVGPLSAHLGILGMTGVTAHYGLLAIGKPKPGDTVVVSAAAGAVGGVVGQIAKIKGCQTVGIAGGQQKCDYVVRELGFDACIDYRAPDLKQKFEDATPKFVDVSFENVGGPVMDMVLRRLNAHARVTLCGLISEYESATSDSRPPLTELIKQRATMTGFIVSEHLDYWPGAIAELAGWLREGKLKYRESVADGLEAAPEAFIGMLKGKNFGKQIVQVGPELKPALSPL